MGRGGLTALAGFRPKEVSLVREGANEKKRFPISKQKETEMDFEEILKAVLETELEDEAPLNAYIEKQKLTEKEQAAVKGMMRIGSAFKENATIKGLTDKMAEMVGYPAQKTKKQEEEEEEEMKAKKQKEEEEKAKKQKKPEEYETPPDGVKKSADIDARFEEIRKEHDDAISKEREAREKVEKQLGEERRERVRKELIVKCEKEFSHVPGMSSDQMADMLLKARDTGEEFAESIEKQWAETSAAIEKSSLLTAAGVLATGTGGGGAWDRIQQLADGMVQKDTDGSMNQAKAIDLVLKQQPELYKQYMDENPKQGSI